MIGVVIYNKLLVSLLDSLFIQYNSKILLALYTDTGNHTQIKAMTVLSSLNNIYYYLMNDPAMMPA